MEGAINGEGFVVDYSPGHDYAAFNAAQRGQRERKLNVKRDFAILELGSMKTVKLFLFHVEISTEMDRRKKMDFILERKLQKNT